MVYRLVPVVVGEVEAEVATVVLEAVGVVMAVTVLATPGSLKGVAHQGRGSMGWICI
jgi:hypothetical protein